MNDFFGNLGLTSDLPPVSVSNYSNKKDVKYTAEVHSRPSASEAKKSVTPSEAIQND
jgi:hypothetical protein